MTKSAVVIIPTTGADTLIKAIQSIAEQSYKNVVVHIVVDGKQFFSKVKKMLLGKGFNVPIRVDYLQENVGANGFYGHRIYAAYSHLVNEDYLFFLDQDNWFAPNHIKSMIDQLELSKSDWVYSLRNICDKDGNFICEDNCENLGEWEAWTNCYHVDTNCYCLTNKAAVAIAGSWHGGWGQDRVVFGVLKQYFPNFSCNGEYTLNYRLDGNEGSVPKEFFIQGNEVMSSEYKKFPWRKYANN